MTQATPATAPSVSVVVPLYNERDNVAALIDAVADALHTAPWAWELLLVDDGSRDGTAALARAHAAPLAARLAPHAHVRVIALRRNFRQTAAMQAGIDAARGTVIVTMDGDLQNDPGDIPALVQRLCDDDLDLVAGWRVQRQDGWWLRKLPSQIANRLIRRLTGLPFHDLGCSLKAYRASVIREVRLYGEMHRFIPAWMATVTSPDRMAEVPVRHHPRRHGQSKYGLSRTFRVIVDLLAVHFFLHYGSRPGHFFGSLGLALGGVGMAILGYLGVLKLLGDNVGGRPLLILGFFALIAGLQFLTTGVLAELLIRIYFDGTHARAYRTAAIDPPHDADAPAP